MSIGSARAGIQPAVPLRHRLSIGRLLPDQVKGLRRAFSEIQKLKAADDRGYMYHAGIHGLPNPYSCKHNSPIFLPWHRAYLYFFEQALRDRVPDLKNFALPWWDWASKLTHEHGIPAAYAKKGGNPLHAADIDPVALQQAKDQGVEWPARTERDPGDPHELPTGDDVKAVLQHGDFLDFSEQVENLHGAVHVWVGGHMSDITFAAFDPIFWSHHATIDRIWRLWQVKHPNASVPRALRNQALKPFSMTVEQTIEMTSLGYDYAATRVGPRS
jgi:tyrosinase